MLIQVLANGGRVSSNGNEYAMAEDGSMCMIMHDSEGNEQPMRVDCDLAAAKKIADGIGQDTLWLQCCSIRLRAVSAT
jgi:hypothetical protein